MFFSEISKMKRRIRREIRAVKANPVLVQGFSQAEKLMIEWVHNYYSDETECVKLAKKDIEYFFITLFLFKTDFLQKRRRKNELCSVDKDIIGNVKWYFATIRRYERRKEYLKRESEYVMEQSEYDYIVGIGSVLLFALGELESFNKKVVTRE